MTTATRPMEATVTPSSSHDRGAGPSIHVIRARRLLRAGLTGGLIATAASLLIFGITGGLRGVVSALAAAGIVLFFYVVGQSVMVRVADAGAQQLMIVSMVSYFARVTILGMVLVAYQRFADQLTVFWPLAVFLTAVAVVVGWLAVEIVVFNRLRIGVYDTEYVAPSDSSGGDQ